jgi:hypothetical protein
MVYSSTLDAFAKIGAREVRAPGLRGGGLPACCRLLLLGEGECAAAAAAVESACQGCTASTSGSSCRCRCLPACSQPAFCVAFHPPACLPAGLQGLPGFYRGFGGILLTVIPANMCYFR